MGRLTVEYAPGSEGELGKIFADDDLVGVVPVRDTGLDREEEKDYPVEIRIKDDPMF